MAGNQDSTASLRFLNTMYMVKRLRIMKKNMKDTPKPNPLSVTFTVHCLPPEESSHTTYLSPSASMVKSMKNADMKTTIKAITISMFINDYLAE